MRKAGKDADPEQSPNVVPLLVTYEEAAAMLSLSKRSLIRLVEEGTLLCVYPTPRTARIPRADVENFAAQLIENARRNR
ncbi:DNA-binding protein [bacterium]|nr:MAG: DNA-binding protein [bacterium]